MRARSTAINAVGGIAIGLALRASTALAVLSALGSGCIVEDTQDVDATQEALYIGSLNLKAAGPSYGVNGSIATVSGSRVEYSIESESFSGSGLIQKDARFHVRAMLGRSTHTGPTTHTFTSTTSEQ